MSGLTHTDQKARGGTFRRRSSHLQMPCGAASENSAISRERENKKDSRRCVSDDHGGTDPSYSTRVSPQFANRMVDAARSVLNRYIPDIYLYTDVYKGEDSGK